MIDPEPIYDGDTFEPDELDQDDQPLEHEPEGFEADDPLDEDYDDSGDNAPDDDDGYQRLIDAVAEQVAQIQQGQRAPADPYAEVADLIREDPAAAIQRTVDIATLNAVQAMLPFVKPAAESHGLRQAMEGLDEEGQAYLHSFVREKGIDPSLLNDPTIADLVRSKAELHQLRQSGRDRPIPYTESVGGYPAGNVDSETQRELNGIEKLYRNLNLKFEPGKLLRRMK